jgi:PBP1b-binding outer membrane lipoprotein LpoB
MRLYLNLLSSLLILSSCSQKQGKGNVQPKDTIITGLVDTTNFVSFITQVDIKNATKDGFYINDYVVNIDYEEAKKLNSKKIRITGVATIVKGLNSSSQKYSENGKKEIKQGRSTDIKYINNPKIEILD